MSRSKKSVRCYVSSFAQVWLHSLYCNTLRQSLCSWSGFIFAKIYYIAFGIYLNSTSITSQLDTEFVLFVGHMSNCINLQQALVANNCSSTAIFSPSFVANNTVFNKLIPDNRNQSKFIRLKSRYPCTRHMKSKKPHDIAKAISTHSFWKKTYFLIFIQNSRIGQFFSHNAPRTYSKEIKSFSSLSESFYSLLFFFSLYELQLLYVAEYG